MTVYYVNAIYGGGKTTFTTFHALLYHQLYPNSHIYANYIINLPKSIFHYTPVMILPLNEIINSERTLIIIDDIKSLPILDFFITIIASISRKKNLDIMITGQYYTMFSRELRFLSTYEVNVEIKDNLILQVKMIDQNDINYDFDIECIDKYVFPYFNTNQVVEIVDYDLIYQELLKFCKTKKDIVQNVAYLIKAKKEKKSMITAICKELEITV